MGPDTRRRLLRRLSSALLVVGGIILAYPLWSGAYAWVQQDRIEDAYTQEVKEFAPVAEAVSAESDDLPTMREPAAQLERLATAFAERLRPGDPIGRLRIGGIDLRTTILEGVRKPPSLDGDNDRGLLRSAPVHYGLTPLPGQGGPFAVAGHRTTYGAPSMRLGDLRRGDHIVVVTPYARVHYSVAKTTRVRPDDVSVLYDRGYDLVLTTCHPPYSARQRLVVWALQESFELR